MIIYGAVISPYVRKVHVAAREKGIDYTVVPAGPGSQDPGFLAASPFAKIPAIRDGDFTLADSSAIVAWMDAHWPTPALIPAEAEARGRTIWFDEFSDTLLMASGGKILRHRLIGPRLGLPCVEAIAQEGVDELPRCYAYLEGEAARANAGSGWLVGETLTLADIAVATAIRSLDYVAATPDAALYPATAAWLARVHARPGWQAVDAHEAQVVAALGLRAPAPVE